MGFTGGPVLKNLPANVGGAGDVSSTPGPGSSPGDGNGNPLQDSCPKSPMYREAWQATVLEVTKSQTQLSMHACMRPAGLTLLFHLQSALSLSFLVLLLSPASLQVGCVPLSASPDLAQIFHCYLKASSSQSS